MVGMGLPICRHPPDAARQPVLRTAQLASHPVTQMTMTRLKATLLALTLATALAPALPGRAQTTTGDATAPAADGLSLGAPSATVTSAPGGGLPTQDKAEVGQTYYVQNYDAWELRCRKTADGSDPCNLYQLLKDDTGNPVAEINVFPLPEGQQAVAGANVVAPLETLLTKSLGLAIDGTDPKIYPFAFCTRDGCVARVGLTAGEVDAMKKGAVAKVTIVPAAAPDKPVTLEVSLKGFTAGFDAVQASRVKN